ncbi:MAG: hypothetical protein DHS20C09_12990 [marine bacterium B5-7]|nr:MAG: hypothetical protein DHS20C09_12990 [marine bacterium B5-7]
MDNNIFSRILALVVIPVILYMVYIAGSWGLADFYYRSAERELNNWQSGKITLEDKDWDRLRTNLTKAVDLDPNNPEFHEKLALSIEGRFLNVVSKEPKAQVYRDLALQHYRKSVQLRPVWPYAWANLASIKYRLGQIDEEFFEALHNVVKLGPWEPGLQRLVIEIGMNEIGAFPQEEVLFILEVVSRALEKQPYKILELIKKKGFLDLICLLHKDNTLVVDYCKKYQEVKET